MTLDYADVTYSEELLWGAIYDIVPNFKIARESGAAIFAPTALMAALLNFFVERETGRLGASKIASGEILLRAYEDISQNGAFNYVQ